MSIGPTITIEERLACVAAVRVLRQTLPTTRAIAHATGLSQTAVSSALARSEMGAENARKLVKYFKLDSLEQLVLRFGRGDDDSEPVDIPEVAIDDPWPYRALAIKYARQRGKTDHAIRFVLKEPQFQLDHLKHKPTHWWSTVIDETDILFSRARPQTDEELDAFEAQRFAQRQRAKREAATKSPPEVVKSASSPAAPKAVHASKAR